MDKVATYVRVSNHSNAENAVRNQTKKVMDFCEAKGYEVCDSAAVIGNRELAYPMMMKLLKEAKEKGITKIVMASTNRIVGTVDELAEIRKAFEESGVEIEAMDGSHQTNNTTDMVASFLAHAEIQEDDDQETPVMKMT